MYSSLSSVRNALRSSSLSSLLARNHVDLKASRCFSAFPPVFGNEEKSNTGPTRNFDNLPRPQISPQGGQGFPQRPAWNPSIRNRIDFVNRGGDPMRYVRDTVRGDFGSPQNKGESTVDFVHIKIRRNNSFVTVTDSKGNKKFGFSSGSLPDKAGSKSTRFSAEAVSEHVGRMCRSKGVKSVVIKVNGHIHFKKKKQAVMGWIEGYTNSRADQIPVVSIEDTTRKPHNGCRRPKARRT